MLARAERDRARSPAGGESSHTGEAIPSAAFFTASLSAAGAEGSVLGEIFGQALREGHPELPRGVGGGGEKRPFQV